LDTLLISLLHECLVDMIDMINILEADGQYFYLMIVFEPILTNESSQAYSLGLRVLVMAYVHYYKAYTCIVT